MSIPTERLAPSDLHVPANDSASGRMSSKRQRGEGVAIDSNHSNFRSDQSTRRAASTRRTARESAHRSSVPETLFRMEHDCTTPTTASSLATLACLNPGTMLFEDRVRNAEAGSTGSGAMPFLGSSGYSKHVIEEEAESGRDSMMDMDNMMDMEDDSCDASSLVSRGTSSVVLLDHHVLLEAAGSGGDETYRAYAGPTRPVPVFPLPAFAEAS